eukprot:CAMPEP_0183723362 /NCGR_PEP_ID=MMETSP0737-20130205/14951_1 /TAXON_ID=385413 /ORGANISM="Thalassiosira miniscula, Strain CCMP1093" /LENGTH=390 /DNA_ID=CAMNT_0025953623 /DNA_START=43 /DNA_END=1215 /DNA_ORIENTATION=-
MRNSDDNDDDAFWSVAMLPPTETDHSVDCYGKEKVDVDGSADHDNEDISPTQSFTVLPPDPSSQKPLVLSLQMNCNDGVLSDVSGIPWDAALLLSGFLYGTIEGRRLCYEACFNNSDAMHDGGGILELGSGLGIVGLAASAGALSVRSALQSERGGVNFNVDNQLDQEINNMECSENDTDETKQSSNGCAKNFRVVLTDLDNNEILSYLRKNVDANLNSIAESSCCESYSKSHPKSVAIIGELSMNVTACDWAVVSRLAQTINTNLPGRPQIEQFSEERDYPLGTFNMILGSALVYLPGHAAECADTLFHYLTSANNTTGFDKSQKRQAIILQLPDRAGFTTHFVPRCRDLGLVVTCRELEEELVEKVQLGWKQKISSAEDYRLYFIATC